MNAREHYRYISCDPLIMPRLNEKYIKISPHYRIIDSSHKAGRGSNAQGWRNTLATDDEREPKQAMCRSRFTCSVCRFLVTHPWVDAATKRVCQPGLSKTFWSLRPNRLAFGASRKAHEHTTSTHCQQRTTVSSRSQLQAPGPLRSSLSPPREASNKVRFEILREL